MTATIRYSIVAPDAAFARMLARALKAETWRLRFSGSETVALHKTGRDHADVLIYAFDRARLADPAFAETQTVAIHRDRAPVKILLQLAATAVHGAAREETDRHNRTIEEIARACGAQTVLTADLMQTGRMRRLKASGKPNLYGWLALAHAVVRAIKARALRQTASRAETQASVPDAAASLAHLVWKHAHLPESLSAGFDWEPIEDLLDGRVSFLSRPGWGKFPLGKDAALVDWFAAGANLSWQSYFNGLDFLRPALAFWFAWANGDASRQTQRVVEGLRARGLSPDDCLTRAGAIVADFVRANPPGAPANERAYAEGTVSRRVKVLLLYLLCCRKAEERGTPAGATAIAAAWQNLTHALAMLESDEIYPKAGNHGVRQDALFMLAGLLFPKLPYMQRVAQLGQERLEKHQLKRALSRDGVWLENSFGYHCLVINMLSSLAADLRDAGAPQSAAIHGVLARMQRYLEALVKPDGSAPLLGDTAPRQAFSTVVQLHEELERAKGNTPSLLALKNFARSSDTYYFPDAGYFVSHTDRAPSEEGSTAIFFASLSTPKHKQSDDLSVVFSRGSHDLLVDGGTYNKEVSDSVRNAARFDPASHNSFRVNGSGYALRAIKGMRPAGLDGMWQGPGWAAALGHNHAYEDARIARLVIHLKRHHAVIVLDRLMGKTSSAVMFEQFWHLAPDLAPPAKDALPWTFTSARGNLLIAFDGGPGGIAVEHGGPDNPIAWLMLDDDRTVPTPYLRRMLRANDGVMASLFQASTSAGDVAVSFTSAPRDAIEIAARGVGFACRFLASEKNVECLELTQRE